MSANAPLITIDPDEIDSTVAPDAWMHALYMPSEANVATTYLFVAVLAGDPASDAGTPATEQSVPVMNLTVSPLAMPVPVSDTVSATAAIPLLGFTVVSVGTVQARTKL